MKNIRTQIVFNELPDYPDIFESEYQTLLLTNGSSSVDFFLHVLHSIDRSVLGDKISVKLFLGPAVLVQDSKLDRRPGAILAVQGVRMLARVDILKVSCHVRLAGLVNDLKIWKNDG